MKNLHCYILSAALVACGLWLFLYKAFELNFPLAPDTESPVWNVEARVSFDASNKSVKVTLFIPQNSPTTAVMDEQFISHRFGFEANSERDNRKAEWFIRRAYGPHSLYYRATIRQFADLEDGPSKMPKMPAVEEVQLEGPFLVAAESLLAEAKEMSADTETLVVTVLSMLSKREPSDNAKLLLGSEHNELKRMEAAVQILAMAKIPARAVHGIKLEEHIINAPLIHWLEVFNPDKKIWQPFDPQTRKAEIPGSYFAWWRGSDPFTKVKGAGRVTTSVTVSRNQEEAIRSAIRGAGISDPLLVEFSPFTLPVRTQEVFRVLLLVPAGAFIIVLLRTFAGLKTFGTFMPVLVALGFRETQLLWGIILFILVVSLGLSFRFYLERLKLLLVPRLASSLIVVVLLMLLLSMLTNKFSIVHGLSIGLFPMVILTMVIERMSLVWEEQSPLEALSQGAGSLLAAALIYSVIILPEVSHLLFVFPELLLILLGLSILCGRYTGYRLNELRRFRALRKESRT